MGSEYKITPTIHKLLDQLTPMHQSVCIRAAEPFMLRVAEQYKKIRNNWREEINTALFSEELPKHQHHKLEVLLEALNGMRFSEMPTNINDHNDFEIFVQGKSNLCGRNIDVFAQFTPGKDKHRDNHELMLTIDMLVRSGVERINVFTPYSLYQREDKKDEGAVPIGAAVWFKMIEERCKGRLNRLITYDLHAGQAQAFIDRPVDHLSAVPYFTRYIYSEYFMKKFGEHLGIVFYSPDPGGIKRVRNIALMLQSPYGDVDKYRKGHGDSCAGEATNLDCHGKIVVILDDIVDTATTLCEAGDKLYKCGASRIIAMAPHGVLSDKKHPSRPTKALDKLYDAGIHLVMTDSIPREYEFYKHPAIEDVLSLAAPTAEIQLLRRLNFSVSSTLASLIQDIKSHVAAGKRYENIEQYLLKI